jgi:ankyrin repeat protein
MWCIETDYMVHALGNTPLHLALHEGHEDIARFLMEQGADPLAQNNHKVRCMDLARTALRAEMHVMVEKATP